ncbi:glycosyltransferase family 2 protein [Ruminiclostridium cellobioparum]|uniref:Glycosyltransferases involved in cell wall biogenesis n=1 Tax=Ruminiclostridium cellobioparum subsp. termitidis CT1112 TaxID=1195236 RepID=S0FK79_RUMCE|nr:glycosyltransferase family 2 protein [Ruminiclostridium cellobioparum]EMS69574.1 Glycosyltransferases involved in cell wall biogenesis [Ruminiclostridium cellobioparum subsp. termitidis CT1112]
MANKLLSIVVPVYNEQEVIDETYRRLSEVFKDYFMDVEYIFINDGSKDDTYFKLKEIASGNKEVRVINFARNFGHQIAITAGMDYAKGDAVVIIDADLQDPPEVILQMVDKWEEGYEVVYGKRLQRAGETFFKKFTAKTFYRFLDSMTDVKLPVDVGDFRLIDRKVCDAMKCLPERSRYVRGLVSWVGFKQTSVEYQREKRFAGETKYPLKKMLKLAGDGIFSFSYKPLKLATFVGMLVSVFSFIYLVVVLVQKFIKNDVVSGWASSIAVTLFLNGVMLIVIGIMGEYVGRIYEEVKARPLYIVGELMGFDGDNKNK